MWMSGRGLSFCPVRTVARLSLIHISGTGDIATMVLTGAAGLAVAGSSFLSLAKKERAGVDGSADSNEE